MEPQSASKPRAAGAGTELRQRIVSGAVLAGLSIVAVGLGGWINAIWVALGVGLMIWELERMVRGGGNLAPRDMALAFLSGAVPVLVCALAGFGAAILAAAVFGVALGLRTDLPTWWRRRVGGLAALIATAGASFVMLRDLEPDGLSIAIWIVLVVACTDMGGFFAGRRFGGAKLAPRISPGKTWAGAMGGVIAATLCGLLFGLLTGGSALALAGLGAVLSVVSQSGDLAESWLKRRCNVKDSSQLIPGHGGVMDRFDGLAAATLVLGLLLLISPGTASLW